MPTYNSGGRYTAEDEEPAYRTETPYDIVSGQIPLWNSLSGANDRMQGNADRRAAESNQGYWDALNAPTAEQLTAQYDYDPQGRDAQSLALQQMQQWSGGGLTSADQGMLDVGRRRDEQSARSQSQAMQQQAQARGMGGSGMDFASQQMASQQGQQQSSDREASSMAAAQARALQAVQQSGQLGSQMRQQGGHETEMQANAQVDGIQGAFDAAAQRAAGATNQYGTDVGARQSRRDRQERGTQSTLGFIGGLLG